MEFLHAGVSRYSPFRSVLAYACEDSKLHTVAPPAMAQRTFCA